jgi:release factor glutamine methyltransferase
MWQDMLMTIKDTLQTWSRDLGWFETELILAHVVKKDRAWLVAHQEEKLLASQQRMFLKLARRRLKHEPLAYVLGHWNFYGRELLTDKRALIPRPETELLIDRALSLLRTTHYKLPTAVWDVGTGCGAIAITLALERSKMRVVASDISTGALALAKQNARQLHAQVTFVKTNLLSVQLANTLTRRRAKHLLVVANLPYLPVSDKRKLMPDVVKFEPHSALFTKEDGNFLIHRLLQQLSVFQKRDGRSLTLLAEFDPPQAQVLKELAKKYFPSATVSIHQDLCGRNRVLEVRSPVPQKSGRRL